MDTPRAGKLAGTAGREAIRGVLSGTAVVATVVLFAALVFGLGADNDLYRSYDFREIFTYQKAYYRAALLGGRLPLWTPHTFGGWPFAANPLTQTFYPASLLMLVLPQPVAIAADLALHLALAGIGTYLLLRRSFALSHGASGFGGLVYPLSGAFVGHVSVGHVPFYEAAAYIPWILLALDRGVATGFRGVWIWIGGVLLALQLLTGGIPYVWITLLLVGFLRAGTALCRAPRDLRGWTREAATLGVVVALGAGLAAVQLLPADELIRLSSRAHLDWDYAAEGSLPMALLPMLVFPRLGFKGLERFWEYYGYPGAMPLLLALASLTLVRREPRILVLWAVSGLALLFAVGRYGFLFPFLWQHVPGFGTFRAPARAVVVLGLMVSVASALMLDALTARMASRARATLIVLAVSALTFADVTLAARSNRDRLSIPGDPTPAHPLLVDTLRRDPSWYRFWFARPNFRANHAYALGARTIGGYDNLVLERYARFVRYMTDTPASSSRTDLPLRMFADASTPFPFKVLGVKYSTYQGQVWANSGSAIRRAWFVSEDRRVIDESEALSYIRNDRFRPYEEVVFEVSDAPPPIESPAGLPAPGDTDVVVREISPEHLRIEVGPHARGFLVLSEIFYPGWRATVGDREVAIHRADSILRCVPLAPEDREVDMVYAPRSLRLGLGISAAAVAIVVAGLCL